MGSDTEFPVVGRDRPPVGVDDAALDSGRMQRSWLAADVTNLRLYDEIYLPAVFHPWGCLLAGALAPRPGTAGLDLGCGPGTVARILSGCLGRDGTVVALDHSAGMLRLAAEKPPVPDGAPISYLEGGLAALPLPDASVDVISCQQAIQFAPETDTALAQMRRVLRPAGRLGLAAWTGIAENPLFRALHEATTQFLGREAAERLRRPWAMSGELLARAVARAGFENVAMSIRTLPTIFPGGVRDACTMLLFSPVSSEIAELDTPTRRALHDLVGKLLEPTTLSGTLHTATTATIVLADG